MSATLAGGGICRQDALISPNAMDTFKNQE